MKIGDKVICIDDSEPKGPQQCSCNDPLIIKKGQLYVIESLRWFGNELGIKLVGVNQETQCHWPHYEAYRFRLLDEMKKSSTKKGAVSA